MVRITLGAGLLALALVATPARADDDVITLKLPDTPARILADEDADTIATGYRGGFGGFRGGFRGGNVGFRGGFYGGYRGGWGGGWRGGWAGGWGGGWAGGWRGGWAGGWRGGWGGHFAPRYAFAPRFHGAYFYPRYFAPVVTYDSPVFMYSTYEYYDPCAVATPVISATTRTLALRPAIAVAPRPATGGFETAPPVMPRAEGSYDYDGGPSAPVPMPRAEGGEELMALPRVPTPVLDRTVSIRPEPTTGKWSYPAYGEQPRRTGK